MRVRRATSGDVPWLCDALEAFAGEYPAQLPLADNRPHSEALVAHLLDTQFVAIAQTADAEPVGLLAALCEPHPFNPSLRIASELWWWVVPAYRGSTAGGRLFAAFEAWAREQGAHAIAVTLEATSPLADAALVARGYAPTERQFLRPLVPVS